MNDIAIIGAGAAGLATAVMLRKRAPEYTVTVFEAAPRAGKKLSATGNGQCNISNRFASAEHYHGDPALAGKLLSAFPYDRQKAFFADLGLPLEEEPDGKVYPLSRSASSVTDILRFSAVEEGAELRLSAPVFSVRRLPEGFEISGEKEPARFRAVLIACGGKAGLSPGAADGYRLLRNLGHKIEPLAPAIVQIRTDPAEVRPLKGVKVIGTVTLETSRFTRSETGEILFCDYGLSGPPILQVSRLANEKGAAAVLDLFPRWSEKEITDHLRAVIETHPRRLAGELGAGWINKRLWQVLLKRCGGDLSAPAGTLNEETIRKTAAQIKRYRVSVTGAAGMEHAQITAGGAQTAQFFDDLMSKKVRGLFAAGEILNVAGDCGGYNLAFCWACANAAADGMIRYLKK